jgi:hypothetical protein
MQLKRRTMDQLTRKGFQKDKARKRLTSVYFGLIGDNEKSTSDTLISGVITSRLVKSSRILVIELSDALEHSRRLIDESSSIIAKLKVKRLFDDAP